MKKNLTEYTPKQEDTDVFNLNTLLEDPELENVFQVEKLDLHMFDAVEGNLTKVLERFHVRKIYVHESCSVRCRGIYGNTHLIEVKCF